MPYLRFDDATLRLVRHDRLGNPGFDLWICRPKLDAVRTRLQAAGAVLSDDGDTA